MRRYGGSQLIYYANHTTLRPAYEAAMYASAHWSMLRAVFLAPSTQALKRS